MGVSTDTGGSSDGDGWYDPSSDGSSDPGSSDPGPSDPGASDPSAGSGMSGDDSSGGGGDDGSGDDSSSGLRHRPGVGTARIASYAARIASQPATPGPNGCWSCDVTCVVPVGAIPAGQPNSAAAQGASDVSFGDACVAAQAQLARWASDQGTSLALCRIDGAGA